MNKEIQSVQMQIQEAKGELESEQGSLVVKNQRLAEEEEKLRSLQIRQAILHDLRLELEKTNKEQNLESVSAFLNSSF